MPQDDFTFKFPRAELSWRLKAVAWNGYFRESVEQIQKDAGIDKRPGTWRYSGRVTMTPDPTKPGVFRALICRCDDNAQYSATFRGLNQAPGEDISQLPSFDPVGLSIAAVSPGAPSPPKWLFKVSTLIDVLWPAIARDAGGSLKWPLEGLIVVTGRTGIAKSQIAVGIMDKYLEKVPAPHNRPNKHVITLQDPVEGGLVPPANTDHTPRGLGADYCALDEATEDCLRQTPTVVYIGEIRNRLEWTAAFRLASSGHLCVTTSHAGSLVEAMRAMMEALGAQTADARSAMAGKLHTVIHLGAEAVGGTNPPAGVSERPYLVPALWGRSERSTAAFVSDGLASVLPHRDRPWGPTWSGCLGRRYFAEELLARITGDPDAAQVKPFVITLATGRDLKGV